METNRCPSCGAIIDTSKEGIATCSYCGTKVYINSRGEIDSNSELKIAANKTKKNKPLKTLIVVCVIALIVVLGVVLSKYSENNAKVVIEEQQVEETITTNTVANAKSLKVGDGLLFGTYEQNNVFSDGKENIEWIVLSRNEKGLLLISKKGLDSQKYNNASGFTNWNDSSIRKWLNSDFYNEAFNEEEKKYILNTSNTIEYASNVVSDDNVFLLSITEAEQLFESNEDRIIKATEYSIARGVDAYDDGACWWWLRTVCEDNEYVMNVRSAGNLRYASEIAANSDGYAIRPAIWISYEINSNNSNTAKQQPKQSNGELIILDEKMGVYNSPMADRQWVRAIYKNEKLKFYEIKNDGSYNWYRIGNNEWIKDPDGSRVQITKSLSTNQNTTFTIEIVDEKIGVYNSHYDNREWVRAVYAGERYTCYESYNDGVYIWYRIGNNEWIKDPDGTRVKTINNSSNDKVAFVGGSDLIKLDCYETMLDGSSGYYYRIGNNDWIRSKDRNLINKNDNTITINKKDYQIYHLNGYSIFYTTNDDGLIIYGYDNDGLNKELSWPSEYKNNIKEIYIGQDIIGISSDSFVDWKIEKIIFSGETKIFDTNAFNNCVNLKSIEYTGYGDQIEKLGINDYLLKYGNAFGNCPLEEIIYS